MINSDKGDTVVALVTGGASGIGKAIAEGLSAQGFMVVITDIDEKAGTAVADSIEGVFIHADLYSKDHCFHCVESVVKQVGRLDILINNAGIQHICPIEDFPEEKWESMIQLMLISPFRLIKHAWPFLKRSGRGRVVNIGSIHSVVASLNKSAYISAKHGLVGLTRSASLEGGPFGITVNAVCPAYVRTPLMEKQIEDQARNLSLETREVEEKVFLKLAAVKRFIEPDEVAELIKYLCSEQAGAVTGAIWNMDLGWTVQ